MSEQLEIIVGIAVVVLCVIEIIRVVRRSG